jgi:hypothetical protein
MRFIKLSKPKIKDLMSRKIIPIGISLVCCSGFLLLVLAPGGCAFNLLPYEIHESMSRGGKGESQFITIFDVLFSIGIFLLVLWINKKWLEVKA